MMLCAPECVLARVRESCLCWQAPSPVPAARPQQPRRLHWRRGSQRLRKGKAGDGEEGEAEKPPDTRTWLQVTLPGTACHFMFGESLHVVVACTGLHGAEPLAVCNEAPLLSRPCTMRCEM